MNGCDRLRSLQFGEMCLRQGEVGTILEVLFNPSGDGGVLFVEERDMVY